MPSSPSSILSLPTRRLAWLGGVAVAALVTATMWPTATAPVAAAPVAAAKPVVAPLAAPRRMVGATESAKQFLQFEPNRGQAAKSVRYLSRGPRHQVEIFDDGIALASLHQGSHAATSARLSFAGIDTAGSFEAREPGPGVANYLSGSDAATWIRAVPRYRQLRRADLYPGIDLVYYSRGGELEFDLVVKPGADPSRIRMNIGGSATPTLAANGDLLLDGADGALRLHRPVLYQHIDGKKTTLEANYVLDGKRRLRFALPAYDKRYPLVIDPVFKLLYSTYLTGFHDEQVGAMVLDAQSNAFVVGQTNSDDFVVSGNAYRTGKSTTGLAYNVVVTKFDASGTLVYSTYLGGSGSDIGAAIAVDAAGNAYVTGNTTSRDFPVTAGAQQRTFTGSLSAFLAVLSPDGSALAHSTYYGGSGSVQAKAIALDGGGAPVIAGFADTGLVTTPGAYKTTLAVGEAAFVARFSAIAGGAPRLLAASYYGVDNPQANATARGNQAFSMALDGSGAPWLTGQAYTTNLPTTAGAVQAAPAAMSPSCAPGPGPLNAFAFVARLSADLASLTYASYLTGATEPTGGAACSEFGRALVLDAVGNVYVTGGTASAAFPTTAGAAQTAFPSAAGVASYTGFVTKLKADGSAILWSTYLGGNGGNTFPAAIALDPANGALWTTSVTGGGSNYPVSSDAIQRTHGGGGADAGLVQLDAATGALKYSTFLGGNSADVGLALGVDAGGTAFVAGNTFSANFPVTSNAYDKTYRPDFYGGADWFFSVLGNGTIGAVYPASGGNGGDVTLQIRGAGIQSGATVSLVGTGTSIPAAFLSTVSESGLNATFPLNGAAPGVYALFLQNPDGSNFTRANAFTIEAGGKPQVSVTVLGRSKIRNNVPSTFAINILNAGNVDSYFQTLWISFPSSLKFRLRNVNFGTDDTIQERGSDADDGRHYIGIIVPRIEAHSSYSVLLDITDPVGNQNFDVQAYLRYPWFANASDARAFLNAMKDRPVAATGCTPSVQAQQSLNNCFANMAAHSFDRIAALNTAWNVDHPDVPVEAIGQEAIVRAFATDLLASLDASIAGTDGSPSVLKSRAGVAQAGTALGRVGPAGELVKVVEHILFGTDHEKLLEEWADKVHNAWINYKYRPFRFVKTKTRYSVTLCNGYTVTDTWCDIFNPATCFDVSYKLGVAQDPPGWQPKPEAKPQGASCSPSPNSSSLRTGVLSVHALAGEQSCPEPNYPDSTMEPSANQCSGSGGAVDPNDKSGPNGDGSNRHHVGTQPLGYLVAFENVPSATLPAAQVVVTDQLDPAKVDMSTLALGPISFGGTTINVPAGLRSYAKVQPISSAMSVRVQGSLNPTTGLLKWTFTTLDPATGLPPSDPTLGFLPPDTDGVKGQGYVSFTVTPKTGLSEGTQIANTASVVFDTNPPIVTPTWVNTIDRTAPTSKVQSLVGKAGTESFDVTWSSPADAGSAVRTFTVYVSDNGAAFTTWKSAVGSTSAIYAGSSGHSYSFYSIAVDGAGNTEAPKATAEATIAVNGTFPDPTLGTSSGGGGGCMLGGADRLDVTLPLIALLAAAGLGLGRRRRYNAAPNHDAAYRK